MSRTIAIGDVHGQWEKLLRLLETIGYENTDDILIFLGDYADARKQGIDNHNAFKTWSVIDSITNKICLLGNHDIWARDYLNNKMHEDDEQWWLDNGGIYTVREFQKLDKVFQLPHLKAFYSSLVKYHETDTFVCVHGGFPIKQKWIWPSIPEDICCWSRTIPECIGKGQVFDNLPKIVILGHTPTTSLNKKYASEYPIISGQVVLLDTGAGYGEKLSAYCIETKEIWSIE